MLAVGRRPSVLPKRGEWSEGDGNLTTPTPPVAYCTNPTHTLDRLWLLRPSLYPLLHPSLRRCLDWTLSSYILTKIGQMIGKLQLDQFFLSETIDMRIKKEM